MDSAKSTTAPLREKLWTFVEGALFQMGVGLVLIAIGALLSSRTVMVLALPVFVFAAYRAGLFHHDQERKRVLSRIFIPVGITVALIVVWLAALKLKAWTGESSSSQQPTAPTQQTPAATANNPTSQNVASQQVAETRNVAPPLHKSTKNTKQSARPSVQSALKETLPQQGTGPDMKMLANVLSGHPVPPTSSQAQSSKPISNSPPPPGMIACANGQFVPEHHAEMCGNSNVVMRYNVFQGGAPVMSGSADGGCGVRNSRISNNVYRNGAVPDLSHQCDSQFNNNLTEGKTQDKDRPQLKIGGKENDIGHNTFPTMDVETTDTSQGNKLHDNSFQDAAMPGQVPAAKDGTGANLDAINKAQTRNQYPGIYPDKMWPKANAVLHGTTSGVADQIARLVNDGQKVIADFMKDNDSRLVDEREKQWEAEVQSVLATNLGSTFAREFADAESTSTAFPPDHSADGGSVCNLIIAKIDVLATFINQLRAASP